MKRRTVFLLILFNLILSSFLCQAFCSNCCPSNVVHSKTFFMPRQVTYDSTYELALANYAMYHSKNVSGIYFFLTPLYQQSTNAKNLARYFLPNGKSCIAVAQNGAGDVDPIWLQLMGTPGNSYSSILSIRPKSRSGGGLFTARINLDRMCEGLKDYWFTINTAILYVNHQLHLCENPSQQLSCPPNTNLCWALNNPTWCAGKFHSSSATGLDDIQLKFGYDWYRCADNDRITWYLLAGIPTNTKPKSKYIFESLVGSNHFCLGAGLNTDREIWECNDHQIIWMMDLKYRYVLGAKERRSFDLCMNLDWSRYLLLACENDPITPLPAINFLTFNAKVTPGNTIDFWTALHYRYYEWRVELGYNLWWRAQERISIKSLCNLNQVGIFDIAGAAILNPVSASTANISQSIGGTNPVTSDSSFISLLASGINTCSAQHPPALTNKIYLAFDYATECYEYFRFAGLGASYEFAADRNSLEQWALFAKFGFEF